MENKYELMWKELEERSTDIIKADAGMKDFNDYMKVNQGIGEYHAYTEGQKDMQNKYRNIMKEIKEKHFPQLLKTKVILKYQSCHESDMDRINQLIREIEKNFRQREMGFDINYRSDEELRGDPFFY